MDLDGDGVDDVLESVTDIAADIAEDAADSRGGRFRLLAITILIVLGTVIAIGLYGAATSDPTPRPTPAVER